jgi:penicillin-binding protein 1B
MDDMLKDVINRGTAAQARGWGFQNVAGKTGFAGKTGTSRDGWFAGFTPELVCVVYVGFDNGDDLDMKGADSAMPIWADFMKEALARNPQWNGDWSMPADVHRAEIDTRDGTVIRELDPSEGSSINDPDKEQGKDKQEPVKKKIGPSPIQDDPNALPADDVVDPLAKEKSVPPEFRRVELFVAGTIPMKSVPSEDTELPPDEPLPGAPLEEETPLPTPTEPPVNGTWQDPSEPLGNKQPRPQRRTVDDIKMVAVMICPITGLRATSKCPNPESKTFKAGSEPKDFCTFHR